jgi:hypothetical protein
MEVVPGLIKMCVDWSSILFKFHCTWCHIPKTGIVGIPLLILGNGFRSMLSILQEKSPQCHVERRLDRSRACLEIALKRPYIPVLNQTPANQYVRHC